MTESSNFHIENNAVGKIIELRQQEPGDKEYALFLQIDGMQGNQYTYDLSFLDVEEARSDEFPKHTVEVSSFWMDQTEVTNAQFKKFVDETGYITTAERKINWAEAG